MKGIFLVLCTLGLLACQDKVICPAFQSTYILDDSTRNAYFSYVWQLDESTRTQFLSSNSDSSQLNVDSAITSPGNPPLGEYYAFVEANYVPWRTPERTKYGIVRPVFMPLKKYRMRTAPMENIFGPDRKSPLENQVAEMDSVTKDSLSLAASDTLRVQPAAEESEQPTFLYGYNPSDKFNVEQLYYNKYFSYRFIDNRPKAPKVAADTAVADSVQAKTPFFQKVKNLFKRKEKPTDDSLIDSLSVSSDPLVDPASESEGNE
ncbi:MAG: hypothetical protein AAF616_08050 [Bacteroidota bacterium]